MALVLIGPHLILPPAGVDVSDAQSLKASIHLLQPKHFVFPFLAHALGWEACCRSRMGYGRRAAEEGRLPAYHCPTR